jgi:hypothetical protein
VSDDELLQQIRKLQTIKALRRAKARVVRLERELRGETVQAEESTHIPDFLRSLESRVFVHEMRPCDKFSWSPSSRQQAVKTNGRS